MITFTEAVRTLLHEVGPIVFMDKEKNVLLFPMDDAGFTGAHSSYKALKKADIPASAPKKGKYKGKPVIAVGFQGEVRDVAQTIDGFTEPYLATTFDQGFSRAKKGVFPGEKKTA